MWWFLRIQHLSHLLILPTTASYLPLSVCRYLKEAFTALKVKGHFTVSSFRCSGDNWNVFAGCGEEGNNYLSQWAGARQAADYKRFSMYRMYGHLFRRETGRDLFAQNPLRLALAPYAIPVNSSYQLPLATGIEQHMDWAYHLLGMAFGSIPPKGLSLRDRILFVQRGYASRSIQQQPASFMAAASAGGMAAAMAGASAGGASFSFGMQGVGASGLFSAPAALGAVVGAGGAAAIAAGPGGSGALRLCAIFLGVVIAMLCNFFHAHWAVTLLLPVLGAGAVAYTHLLLKC